MPLNDFKCFAELAEENPNGLATLPSPCNFSNNPGFLLPAVMGLTQGPLGAVEGELIEKAFGGGKQ